MRVGIDVLAGSATISRSIITNATDMGLGAEANGRMNVESCIVSHNGSGLWVVGSLARATITAVDIFENGNGLIAISGGTVGSFGNNMIRHNTTNGAPTVIFGQQ